MKKVFQILLIIAAVFLAVLAFRSIMRPEKYKMVYEIRKEEIRNRLTTVRAVQAVYKNENKTYCGDIDSLADFAKNGTVSIVKNIGNIPEGMSEDAAFKAGLLRKETEKVKASEKIIETDPASANFLKDFQYIPHGEGKTFTIEKGSIASRTYEIPVYRIDVPLDDVLINMEENITPKNSNIFTRFINYILYDGLAEEEQYKVLYQPMWLGSLTEASTSGSWE